jgi:hypothetical protein
VSVWCYFICNRPAPPASQLQATTSVISPQTQQQLLQQQQQQQYSPPQQYTTTRTTQQEQQSLLSATPAVTSAAAPGVQSSDIQRSVYTTVCTYACVYVHCVRIHAVQHTSVCAVVAAMMHALVTSVCSSKVWCKPLPVVV